MENDYINSFSNYYLFVTPESSTWYAIINMTILIIGIVGNILLLVVIFKDPKKCFQNRTTYFIINLAITDTLNSLFYFLDIILYLNDFAAKHGFTATAGIVRLFLITVF